MPARWRFFFPLILALATTSFCASAQDSPLFASPAATSDAPSATPGNSVRQGGDAPTAIAPPLPNAPSAPAVDPALTTRQAAIGCAVAQIAEKAGQTHSSLPNPLNAAFKSGLCTGRVQTYMLSAESAHADCFPRISLEEGISIFVKWAEAHPDDLAGEYTDGLRLAFEEYVPCLKGKP